MVMSLEVIELKKKLLDLLREDEEFRLAIAGLLGYSEILKRLDRHEEELKKLREDFLIFIKEQERRWEETYKRLDRHEEEFKRVWESIERLRQDFLTFVKNKKDVGRRTTRDGRKIIRDGRKLIRGLKLLRMS